ncbi:MAG: hypothetical protein D3923_10800 [Candidatus Electrothrix sp. AR3]|nr:hypothetical protein [Candidatus Electrothrix sp. AR3]
MKKNKEQHTTSLARILPLVESLPQADKFQLMQSLLTQLAWEQGLSLQRRNKVKSSQGKRMAAVLQRMADRHALSHIDDPAAWQREVRKDRPLPGRE